MMVHLKIKEIKQGHKSVNDYIIQFKEHEGFTSFNDAARVEIFKEGLSTGILSCCYSLEAIPSTLTTWKAKSRLFIVTTLSCSSGSSILGAHSPSNTNISTSPSLAHLIRVGGTHWHPPLLPPPPLSSQSRSMPNWAKLIMANAITVVEKGIGHVTAPRKAQVPNTVVHHSNAARSGQPIHQSHILKKGLMMTKRVRVR
jgi:hypothetical protein